MNDSERITAAICENSFLSFWSFPRPCRKDNSKELTDVLVVCDPYVILISVKDVQFSSSGNLELDSQRWYKRAIEKSYDQLYGAERIISHAISPILTATREHEIRIPSPDRIKLFRIGVSVGRRQGFALPFGHFETGFVHFFDQLSFPIMLMELDTITDFTRYLETKEHFFDSGKTARFQSEEDLLAIYLHGGRKLPDNYDRLLVEPLVWHEFIKKTEFKQRKEQENNSYIWDRIIKEVFHYYSQGNLLFQSDLSQIEEALRAMAKEDRFNRMMLTNSFFEFIGFYEKPKARARLTQSQSGITYVFLRDEHREDDRRQRIRELKLRCLAARNVYDSPEIVGIATNSYIPGGGHSYDLCYLYVPVLNSDEKKKLSKMQEELGYFNKVTKSEKHYDEYPGS